MAFTSRANRHLEFGLADLYQRSGSTAIGCMKLRIEADRTKKRIGFYFWNKVDREQYLRRTFVGVDIYQLIHNPIYHLLISVCSIFGTGISFLRARRDFGLGFDVGKITLFTRFQQNRLWAPHILFLKGDYPCAPRPDVSGVF